MKTVKINVEIGNKDTLQNELNNLGKDVSLKIDLTETNASLKSLVNGIASLNSKLNDIDFSKLKGIGASAKESNKELKETTNVLKEMSGKETKVTIVTNSKGSKKEIKEFADEFAKVSKQVKKDGNIVSQSVSTDFKKAENTFNDFAKRLETLTRNGADVSSLTNEFNKLKALDTSAPEQEIKQLNTSIKELETNFKKLNEFKFKNNLKINENLFSGKIDTSSAEKLRNTLENININNLAKDMALFSSEMKNAITSTSNMKIEMKNFEKNEKTLLDFTKRLSELYDRGANIDKLEEQFNKLNALKTDASEEEIKDLDKGIKKLESSFNALEKFTTGANANLKTNLLTGKIDLTEYERLKNILNSITTDNLQSGMAKFNSELSVAVNTTSDVKSQISTLEGVIVKMSEALKSAQTSASKTGNNSLLNSTQYQEVNNQLNTMVQSLEQIKSTGKTLDVEVFNKSISNANNSVKQLNSSITETNSGYKAVQNSLNTMQVKLNLMKNAKILDEGALGRLQNQLEDLRNCTDKNSEAFQKFVREFAEAKEAERQVAKLETALNKIKKAMNTAISKNKINTPEFAQATSSARNLENALREVKSTGNTIDIATPMKEAEKSTDALRNTLKGTASESRSFGQSISQSLSRMGIYISIAQGIRAIWNEFKEGLEYIKEVDALMADLTTTMEKLNHSEINQLVKDTEDLAINLGADATEMLKIASVSATAKDSIDEVISKTKASTILSNLSGIDGGEITKGVLAVTNQFEEFGNVTDETMLDLSDRIIGVAKNLSVDFNDAVGGSLEGVKILGSVAEEMGMSFNATLANVSGVAEMTGQTFSEVSNGLKTIMSRTMRVGDATGEEMLKAEEALDSIGVAIRDKATGNMREFDNIIKDLAGRWDNLTEAERNYIGDAMGGARQLNYVLALMKLHTEDVGNGMTRYQEIMASATNSSGEALNAQLNFANSIEGRLNSLSATANKFWNNLISSSAVKGAIGGLTSLIGALDKTVEIFGSGTIAVLGFTALLSPLITKVYALAKANGILSVAQQALNVVMSMNPVLAVVSALGALLVTIGFVANACDNTTEKIEKMTQASAKFKVANENTTNISGDLEKYVAIQEELEYQTQTIEERNQLEAESATLLDNLVGYNEQSSNIMKNQIYTLEQKEALMKNMLEIEKQTQLKELDKEMMSQKEAIKNYEKLSKTIGKYSDLKNKIESGEEEDYFNVQASKIDSYKETILEAYEANMTYNDSVLLMGDSAEQFGHKLVDIPPELQGVINEILGIEEASEGMTGELNAGEEAFGDLGEEAQDSTSEVNELQLQMADWNVDGVIDAKDEMIRLHASIDDTKTAMENLSDTFKSFENPIEVSTKVIEELNETGQLTDDTWNNVIESGNIELIAGLWLDAGEAKEYYANLNKKLVEGREEIANAEIMYSALEMGLIEENSEAYKMIKQAEAEFVKSIKQQEIADLQVQLNEKYSVLEQEITAEHNKRLESCKTAYEVAQEKYRYEYELQQNRRSLANETNEAIKQIEEGSGENYDLALQSQVEAERRATEEKKAEYEKDKANFVEKAKEKDEEQKRVTQSGKENLTAFVNQAKSNYSSDASSFVSSVNIKESKLASFIRKLSQASSAVRAFNSLNVKSFNIKLKPTGSGNAGRGGVAKDQSINSREFTPVSPKAKSNNVEAMANTEAVNTSAVAPTSNEGAVATPSSTSANGSSGGGNSSGGDGSAPIGGNYDVMPTAIVGGVQHSNPDEGSSGKSSAKKAKELASANKDLTSSVSKLNKELEIELDRYYKLNDVLGDYDAILEEIKDAQEYATAEESYDLQKQELEIMAKQIGIYRQLHGEQLKELAETKNILIQNGFLVDSYGNLINSQEKLGELVNWANSSGSDENKDHVKYLEKLVDLYTELSNKSIPDTLNAIRDLNNEINGIAIDNLTNLRKKLIDALESEREAQKEQEISILDARIEELQKEIDKLEDDSDDKYAKRSKLEAEIRKWQKDDSGVGKSKVKELTEELKELNKEITKSELQNQIDEIEATKESVEETYDDLLSEKSLYEEANRLMTTGSIEEMKALLESQSQDWEDIGVLWGKSFSEAFDKEIRNAMESLSYLKGESNALVNGQDTSSPTPPTPPTPSPQPAQPQQAVTVVSKGSRVKVTDINATIYRDSYTSRGSGTWRGAGVSNSDTLYVVNDSNGRVALSRTQSINGAIGWIEKKKVSAFDTGGYTGDFSGGRLGFLHQKEYVLNQAQTSAWLKLVPMLTELVKTPFLDMAKLFNGIINSGADNPEVTITNNIEINNNSNVDMEKTNKGFEQLVREQLRRYGKIKK